MAIRLNIPVLDISGTITFGYTHIKVYRSAEQFSGYKALTSNGSDIALVVGVSDYTYVDGSGTTEHWFTTTFVDSNGILPESAASSAFYGEFYDTNFSPITYPEEAVFSLNDRYIIDRMRTAAGDAKQLTRDYVSVDTGYSSVSIDGSTHTLSNPRGWPLRIQLNGVEYTDSTEPRVNDYQYLTFSGTQISTVSGTLDIWYYHFRNSDTELLRVFNGLTPPCGLTAEQVPFELALVCAAIEVLEAEVRLFGVTSGSEIEIFQEIRINPKGGLAGRQADLGALRARKDALVACVKEELGGELLGAGDKMLSDIDGALID
jgi:hypothetical protein